MGTHAPEHAIDPMLLKNNPQKQLSWVTNEINHLKILKQYVSFNLYSYVNFSWLSAFVRQIF